MLPISRDANAQMADVGLQMCAGQSSVRVVPLAQFRFRTMVSACHYGAHVAFVGQRGVDGLV